MALILGFIYLIDKTALPDKFNVISWFGYIKVIVTSIKYCP